MKNPAVLSLLVMSTLAAPALAGRAHASPAAFAQEGERHERAERRVYDRWHKDYHVWDDAEDRSYHAWLEGRHRTYRDYSRLRAPERREYWRWRHERHE